MSNMSIPSPYSARSIRQVHMIGSSSSNNNNNNNSNNNNPSSSGRYSKATTNHERTASSGMSSLSSSFLPLHEQFTFSPSGSISKGASSSSSSSSYKRNNANDPIAAARDKVEAWCHQITKHIRQKVPPEAWSILAGTASFGSTLAFSTTLQQRIFGISTGSPTPIPSLVGVASVCLASTTAHQVALATHWYATTGQWPQHFSLWPRRNQSAYFFHHDPQVLDLKVTKIPMHTIRIWTMGLLCFKLLGGRFWAVAPSSLTHLGSYARASLPATEKYATAQQRLQVERLGRLWGCHTCGSHRWSLLWPHQAAQFVGDHMPPKSVAQQLEKSLWYRLFGRKVRYRFYPQCIRCSNQQGSLLSQATAALRTSTSNASGRSAARRLAAVGGGRGASYNHGWHVRIHHAVGGILGAIATINVHSLDLQDENRWRYAQWQDDLIALLRQRESEIKKRVQSYSNSSSSSSSRK